MARGGGIPLPPSPDPPPPSTSSSSGEFLLQLLQKHPSSAPNPSPSPSNSFPSSHHHDPAVAAVGPSHPVPPPWSISPSLDLNNNNSNNNTPLFSSSPYSFVPPPPFSNVPWPLPGFPPPSVPPINAFDFPNSHISTNPPPFALPHQLPFSDARNPVHRHPSPAPPPPLHHRHHQQQQDRVPAVSNTTLTFGSLRCELPNGNSIDSGASKFYPRHSSEQSSGSSRGSSVRAPETAHAGHEKVRGGPWSSRQYRGAFHRPSGEPHKTKGSGQWVNANERHGGEKETLARQRVKNQMQHRDSVSPKLPLSFQIDNPGPPTGSSLHSVPAADIEESLANLHAGDVAECRPVVQRSEKTSDRESESISEHQKGALIIKDEFGSRNSAKQHNRRSKDLRPEFSKRLQGPGHRNRRRREECRSDIERLTSCFLSIYESLIPAEEEKAKQKQLLASLKKLVNKEWPNAKLYLYGSCANAFGVSNSDIDVCLEIDDDDITKPEILLKLAEILQSDNLQNVQALTRARVPIVKLMDPVTEISCDICINNLLAVINTKLLRDYAQIDARLQQLAFIVKHWAKSRGVNEAYHGTLSSYAYVLMCIHFLQMRKPAILPCLQEMMVTYSVIVDDIECAYFDKVEELLDFGAQNKESISKLLWAFFDYWAYRHDYANAVISVRTGSIISKRFKEWTTRIGNDRHLICIEDPFEVDHDLGRVVDRHSIQILRGEFERAADILQYDPNPSVTLFEPYIPKDMNGV